MGYGFCPFVKYRGIAIVDKLSKTCKMVKRANTNVVDEQNVRNASKAVNTLLKTFDKIKHYRRRVDAIQSSLKILVDKEIIIQDIANLIQECVGIHHASKSKLQCLIPKRKRRMNDFC